MLTTNFSDESGHSSRPCASVLGAGGAALVAFAGSGPVADVAFGGVVLAGALTTVLTRADVAVAATVFRAGVFGAGVDAVALGPIVAAGLVIPVADVLGTLIAGDVNEVAAVPVGTAEAGPVDAAAPADADGTAEFEASTPVIEGVDELLTRAAGPGVRLPATAFDRPAIRKMTPINAAMAAAIRRTRRSQ